MEDVVFHVKFEGETVDPEIFCLPSQTKWMDLEAMLKAQFDCENAQIFYIDPEGDYISISSQGELEEAFYIADACSNTLHLVVRDLGTDAAPVVDAEPSAPAQAEAAAPVSDQSAATKKDEVDASTTVKGDDGSTVDGQVTETIKHVDDATGEVTETTKVEIQIETILEMMGKLDVPVKQDVVDETGETTPLLPTVPEEQGRTFDRMAERKMRPKKLVKESRRLTQSADRGAKHKKMTLDLESGESDEVAMPYSVFVKFMQQLKMELRTEIVKDVTKKTVRHVLRGLDGAVIQTMKGTSGVDPTVSSPTEGQGEATPNTDTGSKHPIYYHEGIVCDFCERVIVGARYKCCNCVDYDLCEECEAINGVHDLDHVFLKLRKPARLRRSSPLFKNLLYRQRDEIVREDPVLEQPQPTQFHQDKMSELLQSKFEKIQEKTVRKQERLRRKEEKLLHKQRRKEELLKRRLDTQRDEPLKRERLDVPLKRHVGMDASFLYDVTIPDGTNVQPGTKLLKTWRMKNTGSQAWNDNTKLHLVYGSFPAVNRHQDMDVPELAPGDEVDISVELVAPERPGKYQSHWKMTQNGKQFGHRVWCLINVCPREVLEPTWANYKMVCDPVQNEADPCLQEEIEEPDHKEPEVLLTVHEELVVQNENSGPKEDDEGYEEVRNVDDDEKIKLEQELSCAAAAVAQLKLDQSQQPKSSEPGQDLMSFELLNLTSRGSHKVSQTATPNNTPLDVTPPKSPAPELEDLRPLSNSSSVEVVNAESEEADPMSGQYVRDIMDNLPAPKPDDVDIESLKSFTDEDDSSLSEDDDFLIVPMPACFDFSKPVISRAIINNLSDFDDDDDYDDEEVDDNHNRITPRGSSVDEMLATSGALATPPLDPKLAEDVTDTTQEAPATEPQELPVVAATAAEMPQVADPEETVVMNVILSAAGAAGAGIYDSPTSTESGESSGVVEPGQGEATPPGEAVNEDVHPADGGEASNDGSENGATGEGSSDRHHSGHQGVPPDMFVNQVMATAVKAANKAASNAYTTCKEVFYTWQARAYQNGTNRQGQKYKPPHSTWKPKEDKPPTTDQPQNATGHQDNAYKPPQSSWKPKSEKFKPPTTEWTPSQDKWTPPQDKSPQGHPETDSTPMTKLVEMGFCNRELNQKLLEKNEHDMEKTVQELLSTTDNDWMDRRH